MREQEMIAAQHALRQRIVLHNRFREDELETVAGVDLAYWQCGSVEYGVCCIEVLEIATGRVIESRHHSGRVAVPYIPGLLAFREVPLVLGAAQALRTKPDLYLFDGNGYLHPRRMGLATQAGILLDTSSIGVAKSFYRVGGEGYAMPGPEAGAYTDIIVDGEVCGRALRTHSGVRPVFVSVGTGIDLATATRLTLRMVDSHSHIPAPTRLADLATHQRRAQLRGTI